MTDSNPTTSRAPSPAEWKKPSDIMKVRLKKRSSSSSTADSKPPSLATDVSRRSSQDGDRTKKRRNPFGQDEGPPRRRQTSRSRSNDGEEMGGERKDGHGVGAERVRSGGRQGVELFQALEVDEQDKSVFSDETPPSETSPKAAGYQEALSSNRTAEKRKDEVSSSKDNEPSPEASLKTSCFLPLDWSIKSRVRFTSPQSFAWSQPLKTTEEAEGLCSFVRCQEKQEDRIEDVMVSQSRWKARLHQSLMMWSHPHLPWIKLFPRTSLRSKITSISFAANDEAVQNALMASWSESFRSVFYLLRSALCPYFYLLAHQYTVLFRAAGVGGVRQIHALFTPTTKGLREALKEEGIEFTLPLAHAEDLQADLDLDLKELGGVNGANLEPDETQERPSTEAAEPPTRAELREEEEEEELELGPGDGAAASWLQSMGLDKQSFPSLEPNKVNFQRDHLMKIDNRPQSTILIRGPDTQGLFNFLLNTKTTIASIGSTAGVPPTLLAPLAFQGATLSSHTWRPNVMKQAVGNTLMESYSLDITGPLLPHNIHSICRLLGETQAGCFSGNFNNHEPTAAFSQILAGVGTRATTGESGRTCETFADFLANEGPDMNTAVVRELHHADGRYKWQ